jgi:hypothetical protein
MTTQNKQLPAYEVSDAEIRLVRELFRAGRKEAARELVDHFMEKRWPDVPDRVEPPNLVHLSAHRGRRTSKTEPTT